MACFHVARSGFSPTTATLRPGPVRRRSAPPAPFGRFRCRLQENDSGGDSNGEERPESLFMKELRRRGMTPTSLLEEANRGGLFESGEEEEKEMGVGEGEEKKKRNGVASAEVDKGVADQRERSMALNSEGLEGLIPRAKLLLTIGGTFFLGFWPLILITFVVFAAVYSVTCQPCRCSWTIRTGIDTLEVTCQPCRCSWTIRTGIDTLEVACQPCRCSWTIRTGIDTLEVTA